jgi:hypothetical protein
MEQLLLSFLIAGALQAIEIDARYTEWLAGEERFKDAPFIPIEHGDAADAFLCALEDYATHQDNVPCDLCGGDTSVRMSDLPEDGCLVCCKSCMSSWSTRDPILA